MSEYLPLALAEAIALGPNWLDGDHLITGAELVRRAEAGDPDARQAVADIVQAAIRAVQVRRSWGSGWSPGWESGTVQRAVNWGKPGARGLFCERQADGQWSAEIRRLGPDGVYDGVPVSVGMFPAMLDAMNAADAALAAMEAA